MELKIVDKLKKRRHKEIALLQDLLIDVLYEVFPKAVLHGGTAIWRCYRGNRFSEDIDVYLSKKELSKINLFKERLKQKGFEIKKFKQTENAVYAKLSFRGVEISFESSFLSMRNKRVVVKPYETIDGNRVNVFTLNPEDLLKEKVESYLSRRLIRDLYDIYILLSYVEDEEEVKPYLKRLLSEYRKPKDENILKALVFVGAVPTSQQMLEEVKRWVR